MADEYVVEIVLKADGSAAIRNVDQVQSKLKAVDGAARQGFGGATREAGLMERGVARLQQAVTGFGAAMIAKVGVDSIMQMRSLGQEIGITRARFEALTGDGAAALQILREATGGVITDFELMKTTASAIMTGIAEDATEAGRLISLGMALGGEEGVEKLFQALRNQSYLVLDTVGISASDVRTLAEQYRAAGMESSAAFNRAVIEVGEQTKESLGEAADAARTNWDELQTHIQNGINDLAVAIKGLFEDFAGILNDTVFNTTPIDPRTRDLFLEMIRNRDNPGARAAAYTNYRRGVTYDATAGRYLMDPISQVVGGIGDYTSGRTRDRLVTAYNDLIARISETSAALHGQVRGMWDAALGATGTTGYGVQRLGGIDVEHTAITPLGGARGADQLKDMAVSAAAVREALSAAAERGLVREQDAQYLGSMLDDAIQIAEQAKTAADQYERIHKSLPGLLGTDQPNATTTAITDAVAEQLRDSGMDDEQIQAYIDMMDLTSGRQTELSQAFDRDIVPGIAGIMETYGVEAAVEASRAFERGLTSFRDSGINPSNLFGLTGYLNLGGAPGQTVNVQPGWGWSDVADAAGMSLSELDAQMGFTGGSRPTLHPGALQVGGGMRLAPIPGVTAPLGPSAYDFEGMGFGGSVGLGAQTPFTPMLDEVDQIDTKMGDVMGKVDALGPGMTPFIEATDEVRSIAQSISEQMDAITGKDYEIELKFNIQAERTIKDWIKQEVIALNRANGGVAPGTDARRNTRTS